MDLQTEETKQSIRLNRAARYAEMVYGMSFANPNTVLGAPTMSDAVRAQKAFDAAMAFVDELERRGLLR